VCDDLNCDVDNLVLNLSNFKFLSHHTHCTISLVLSKKYSQGCHDNENYKTTKITAYTKLQNLFQISIQVFANIESKIQKYLKETFIPKYFAL